MTNQKKFLNFSRDNTKPLFLALGIIAMCFLFAPHSLTQESLAQNPEADSFIGIEGFKEGPPPHTAQGHKKRGQKMKEGREGPGNKGAGRRLMKMKRFLNFVSELHTSVSDPTGAAGFAALGIKDYHKRTGQVQNAVPEIEEALKATKKQETRNVLLFTLRQIHEESKDHAAVYEINKRLLKENAQ